MRILKISFGLLIAFILLLGLGHYFSHPRAEDKLGQLATQIEEYQRQIDKLNSQANTLSNQIAQFDAQIKLTTLKISQTQEKIDLLGGRISSLTDSLSALRKAFGSRVVETYKMTRLNEPLFLLLSSSDLNTALSRFHYLQKIQEADRDLITKLTDTQNTYQTEKAKEQELQDELNQQKKNLDSQKSAKANLLKITKNDERKYQQLLQEAKSEYEAIQAIISGRGQEENAGNTTQGAKIASIIQGASCNSSGAHLHFIVSRSGNTLNPFNYLSSGTSYNNCSGSSCGSADADAFNPSGSWIWPINSPIFFNQGYGVTWAVRNTWAGRVYSFHNGIDINSNSSDVKAVRDGVLYRGSYSGSGGCRLRYVRVDHADSDLDTYYLHVNY